MKVAWVSTWEKKCGIADYSKILWPEVQKKIRSVGGEGEIFSLNHLPDVSVLARKLSLFEPDVIHFQHEYGIFGGKNPPFYFFPQFLRKMKELLPKVKTIATAHTVLPRDYRFPLKGRGFQIPLRWVANHVMLPYLHRLWGKDTWGGLDGVFVHSKFQRENVRYHSGQHIEVVPHFVPALPPLRKGESISINSYFQILVFGFFTPEKGQDIVLNAMPFLPPEIKLVLAGGVRRKEDQKYFQNCQRLIKDLHLEERVEVTGFVPSEKLDLYFKNSDLVVIPFRATSGSGSLVQALARRMPILASNLDLNREIEERVPGCLDFFQSEDPKDCAKKIMEVKESPAKRKVLSQAAKNYAEAYATSEIANQTVRIYGDLLAN